MPLHEYAIPQRTTSLAFPPGIIPALQLANAHVGQVFYLPQHEYATPLRTTSLAFPPGIIPALQLANAHIGGCPKRLVQPRLYVTKRKCLPIFKAAPKKQISFQQVSFG